MQWQMVWEGGGGHGDHFIKLLRKRTQYNVTNAMQRQLQFMNVDRKKNCLQRSDYSLTEPKGIINHNLKLLLVIKTYNIYKQFS